MSNKESLSSAEEEIKAMGVIAGNLDKLDETSRRRVLMWAGSRYNVSDNRNDVGDREDQQRVDSPRHDAHGDFASFFHSADPTTEAERTLIASYWLQHVQGQSDFDAATIQKELSNLGHRVSNITVAFNNLMQTKPALAMQTRKSGKSRQARKKYKITYAGLKQVEKMIADGPIEE